MPSLLSYLVISIFTLLAISGQEVAAQTDFPATCNQSMESCRNYCAGPTCESQCKDAFDACGTRVRVMKWLKPFGHYGHES